ncbi:MAG TPA: hypothetical protein VH762_17260 [Gemmatimonadaceae bacterium]|jgi:antitoxin (DNA-binding transcriptional repressor) of toxin-antitoxin stability system
MTPKTRRVSVTEAARNFADLVNRAYYRQETTVLLKNGVPVAHMAPVAPSGVPAHEFLERWSRRPRLSAEDADAWARDLEGLALLFRLFVIRANRPRHLDSDCG